MPGLSSFRVALGRFIWLKIPLTVTAGITRQLPVLLLGVSIFSLAWDALYILMGVFGSGQGLNPAHMLPIMFGVFIVVNASIFLIKRWMRSRHSTVSAA